MTGTSFSIHPRDFAPNSRATLRDQVAERTSSEFETASILRSIERYGEDSSIRYFEIAQAEPRLGARSVRAAAWSVRAVRF